MSTFCREDVSVRVRAQRIMSSEIMRQPSYLGIYLDASRKGQYERSQAPTEPSGGDKRVEKHRLNRQLSPKFVDSRSTNYSQSVSRVFKMSDLARPLQGLWLLHN